MRYQDLYPSEPLLNSDTFARASALALLTLEYFEASSGAMPAEVFHQHHVLLNLREEPQRVENWRDGHHRDFTFRKDDVVVTPAVVRSGWRWHGQSKVIVVTLLPEQLECFAQREMGTLLTRQQLQDVPTFTDPDLCWMGRTLRDALALAERGSEVLFEAMARAFLVKLIQRYGEQSSEALVFSSAFNAKQYQRVLSYVAQHYGETFGVDHMAQVAGLSPSHFSRVFKCVVGESPMRFVMRYRIDEAKRRLAMLELSLSRIATDCGFADQAHLSRLFKQVTGTTPSAYRASLQSD